MRTDMAAVHAALDQLCDPEIPVVSLREMGILRDVYMSDTGVEVVITPTYSGCPAVEPNAEVMVVLVEPQRGHATTSSCKRRVKRTTCEVLVLWQFGGAIP